MGQRIKHELLEDPRPNVGRSTLVIGFILGLVWLALTYIRPEFPWLNGRWLAGAICFAFWGVADILPHRWRSISVVLRAAALVFMVGLGTWIILGVIVPF